MTRRALDAIARRHPGAAAAACPALLLVLAVGLLAVAYAAVLPSMALTQAHGRPVPAAAGGNAR